MVRSVSVFRLGIKRKDGKQWCKEIGLSLTFAFPSLLSYVTPVVKRNPPFAAPLSAAHKAGPDQQQPCTPLSQASYAQQTHQVNHKRHPWDFPDHLTWTGKTQSGQEELSHGPSYVLYLWVFCLSYRPMSNEMWTWWLNDSALVPYFRVPPLLSQTSPSW